MLRWISAACLAFLAFTAGVSKAGEITTCLSSGSRGCQGGVLKNVPFKSVVLEFLDPQKSGIGEAISRLLWRDLLFAIRDMSGRGVILGKEFEDQVSRKYGLGANDLLDERFHEAAVEIGRFLGTQMIVWGAVVTGDSSVTLYSFLTILPEHWTHNLGLGLPHTGIAAGPSQSSFNFKPLVTDRSALFGGKMRVRCALSAGCAPGIPAYSRPEDNLSAASYAKEGEQVDVRDIQGKWMTIGIAGGIAYMNIYHADVGPRAVIAQKLSNVALHPSVGTKAALAHLDLDGRFDVLEMGRGAQDVPWYKIATPQGVGWIDGSLVDPLYRFPLTHFLAGLYRYEAGDFHRSERELQHYLEEVGEKGDRVARSLALQLIAACRAQLLGRGPNSSSALSPLSAAANLTPFDPAIYRMRALISMVAQHDLGKALPDLERAVDLDREDKATAFFLGALERIDKHYLSTVARVGSTDNDFKRIQELRASLEVNQ